MNRQNGHSSNYSAIVIGAGLGGLGAATQLALAGEKVLLLEKHSSPGGFATSFVRGRFEFESALHELSGCGTAEKPGTLYKYFEQLGFVPGKLQFNRAPEVYSCIFHDGQKYDLPYGADNYAQYLIERFPHEKENIIRFMKVIRNIEEGMRGPIKPLRLLFKYPWFLRALGMSIEDLLKRFFTDRRLMNVIEQFWAYLSNSPEDSSAILFIGALLSYVNRGAVFPTKRSHHMSLLLADSVTDRGGEVKYNVLVNRILVENGRAVGVELVNGDRYFADAVISNVNPVCTVTKMLPPGAVKQSYINRLTAPPIGSSIFTVYLGLNRSPAELGIDTYETFINLSDNLTEAAFATGIGETKIMVATCYNLVLPDISPPGTSMVVLSALHPGAIWQNIPPTEYVHVKEKVADDLITIFEKYLCPGIRGAIEVMEIASPLTYYRYSKHLNGTIYGTNTDKLDSPAFKLGVKTPLEGLYFCGSWTGEGGGYDPAFNSGRKAAKAYLASIGKSI